MRLLRPAARDERGGSDPKGQEYWTPVFRCMSTFLLYTCVHQSAERRTVRTTQLKGALRCGLYPGTWHYGNYRYLSHGAEVSRPLSYRIAVPMRKGDNCLRKPRSYWPCDFRSRRHLLESTVPACEHRHAMPGIASMGQLGQRRGIVRVVSCG